MIFFLVALIASSAATLFFVRIDYPHRALASDPQLNRAHKLPSQVTTRVGGLGVFAGAIVSWVARYFDDPVIAAQGLLLAGCATPVVLAGLMEDISKQGWKTIRLFAAFLSAYLSSIALEATLVRLDVQALDAMMLSPLFATLFTCVAVAGVTHAFNIIDGFNGLASGVAAIILMAISYVAFKNGDILILAAGLTGVGAIGGFMLWNFPRGLIYLGDCGAYLLGFWVAELSVLLVVRNSQVSPWFPLVLCAYPVFETLFSIYRRILVKGAPPTRADAAHLHHMIYRRMVRWALGGVAINDSNRRNASTSPYLWLLTSVSVVPALLFWGKTGALQIIAAVFSCLYVFGYVQLLNLRRPRRNRTPGGR